MQTLAEKVDLLFAPWDKPDSPGCALGIVQDGRLIYQRGYGMANLEHDVPITPETVFCIASTAKQFTAMCILLLEEEGQLSLDDDIHVYLPEIPDYGHTITIRHLIHHTSGLRDFYECFRLAGALEGEDYVTHAEAMDTIMRQRELNFPPGEEHVYSNTGYHLLGLIVKRVSGRSLRRFSQENIFQPLGMKNTHFDDDQNEIIKGRAAAHAPTEIGFRLYEGRLGLVGAGSLVTTVEDLFRWDQNFYHNRLGEGRQALIEEMQMPGALNSGEKLDYAFGLTVSDYKGLKSVSHGGQDAGFRSEVIRFPDQSFTVICLSNVFNLMAPSMARRVAGIWLDELRKDEAEIQFVELPEPELADKVGVYRNSATGAMVELFMQEGKLTLAVFGYNLPLAAVSPTRFQALDAPAEIEVVFKGQAGSWEINLLTEVTTPEVLRPIEVVSPGVDQLAEYVGAYTSGELGTTYELLIKENQLQVKFRSAIQGPLKPGFRDMFTFEDVTFLFDRDDAGVVSGFSLHTGRVRNVRFSRAG